MVLTQWREGISPWEAQPPLSPHCSPFLQYRYTPFLLYIINKSLYPHWGGFFVFMRVRCFMRIIERIRRVFVVFS